jgi:HK97 family phage portal protein
MNIFKRILGMFGGSSPVDSAVMRRGDGVWEAFTGGINGAPSERAVMQVTAVSACVTLISGAISSLPMHVYRRTSDGDLLRDANSDLWWILNEEFSPRWTASSGWAFLTASKLLHGDGFAEILRKPSGAIMGLVPIHPDRVRVIATPDGRRLVYEIKPDPTIESPSPDVMQIRVLDQDDVLHVPGFGFNGLRGLSALRNSLRNSGALAINAQTFSEQFLQNMARPDFALKTEKSLTDEQFARLQAMLDARSGPMNAGKPMILEGGLDLKTLTMPLEEMQLLETRKFQVEEIARAFGVQPFMIGHTTTTSSWGSGIEAMGSGFVRYTLRDHLNAFQNEINRKFFRTASRVAEFDTTELERGDTKAMFEAMRVGLGRAGEAPIMTIEEARQTLRLPRQMPEGDTVPQQTAQAEGESNDG